MENPLNTWFFSTGKIVTDSKIQNVTHFMLDGGKIDLTNFIQSISTVKIV